MAEEAEIEETLDRDFLLFMTLAKTYYPQIVDQRDITLCTQWLSKLCGEKVEGIYQKRNRNVFLTHLLMNMQEGKMAGPFFKPPGEGPLPASNTVFGISATDEAFVADIDQPVDDMADDFQERSADGRTYVATRCLPNNQGTYAFVALNIDKELDNATDVTVIPCSMDKSKFRYTKALHELSTHTIPGENPSESEMEDFYIRNIEAKVSGDISQLYEELRAPMGQACGKIQNEIAFFDVLLSQIDEEIRGVTSGNNDFVKFLVSRLQQDLKKVPKMNHIFKLSSEQQHLKILEILRQKLIVRQQEQKRRNLLAEMDECMMASASQSKTCMGGANEPTESMWQLAVTRPLAETDIQRLYDVYPEESIAVFLDLLAEDRQAILERGRKRQNNLIESMRSEVYKEVQAGKAEYNKARAAYREWNEILSLVEEMMYEASNEVIEDVPQQKEILLTNMITDIKQTEDLVVEEACKGEILTEKIVDANVWKFSTQDDEGKNSAWEIKSAMERLRREIETYKIVIENQKHRIKELRDQLDYV
ncbi:uncharacterized protein LOC112493786 [Cephus cinctus]|uniref:Uncharacterized protein LOC112493786 n=1 Tax=Cephus cinctus TaxID=211228 RepID=A0AAJ7VXC8_CEPCN|nr:uncharacterized protein LOC112493786 [Cephus cinctus]